MEGGETGAGAAHCDEHRAIACRARAIICENVDQHITIADLARRCGCSQTALKEAFRETFGMPVYSWSKHYRMMRAAYLLTNTRLTAATIASGVGYANQSKFAQAFVACMRMTPSTWRKRHGCTL